MITIIDYDAGNIKSVANMLLALGVASRISEKPADISTAERLILPGVGHFDFGMAGLERRDLIGALNDRVLGDGVPVLGICLGAQLLTRGSAEGDREGLGWIAGDTVAFDRTRMDGSLRLPHMGWADTWASQDNPLLESTDKEARFYHVHSFHMTCDEEQTTILKTHYGYDFTTGIRKQNVLGVQFHPEKSHRFGMELLRRFSTWIPDAGAMAA